jgi:hypothetical protein
MWEKFKIWLKEKFLPVWKKIGKAVRQFLRWAYAAQISYLVLAGFIWLFAGKFWGVVALAWGVVLLVAEIRQKKAESEKPPVEVIKYIEVEKPVYVERLVNSVPTPKTKKGKNNFLTKN